MDDERFREIWVEIVEMSEQLEILDPNNPLERKAALAISNRLAELEAEVTEAQKKDRLSTFTLIKNEDEDEN